MNAPSSTLSQTIIFSAAVLVLGLLNSFLNPTALDLGRDYFPKLISSDQPVDGGHSDLPQHDFGVMTADLLLEFLPELMDSNAAVLIDARSSEHYEADHIPGAYLVHHYTKDNYIDAVLPQMREAGYVIVYCRGGDCEDSIFLATDLVYHHGIEKEVIYIYEGGIAEWESLGHPLKEGIER